MAIKKSRSLILAGGIAGLLYAAPAMAANICVDSTAFTGGAPGQCAATCDGSNDCDIRDAVAKADLDNTPDTIIFDPAIFPAGGGTTITTTSSIFLSSPVTIQGPGADSLIVDNNGNGDNVFEIDHGAFVSPAGPHTISGLTATGGDRGVRAIHFEADVILDSLVIEGNGSVITGGGVWNQNSAGATPKVRIQNCVIANNTVSDEGGGVDTEGAAATEITNSLIIGNSATAGNGNGGGVAVIAGATTTITDSVISGNDADNNGGGIYLDAGSSVTVTDSVISENTVANFDGGGIMVFNDNASVTTSATITGTSIVRNSANSRGGGIEADGTTTNDVTKTALSVTNSTISGNETVTSDGGGIDGLEATITVTGTTIDGNRADTDGGGINSEDGGDLTVTYSTLSNNAAGSDGGGIKNDDALSSVNVTNSTISSNSADNDGGGISNDNNTDNTVTLINVTITENRADANFGGGGMGGGIEQESGAGAFTITNSIIANNFNSSSTSTISPDCSTSGTNVTSGGNNLIGSDAGCADETFDTSLNDQVGSAGSEIPPLLGPLTPANGGDPANGLATGIHEPLAGSPAIDGVDATVATAPADDQRGVARPIDGDASGTAEADIGSVEAGCGDGVVNLGEVCDDGGESAACNANCTTSACGDTVINASAGETCDDGNTTAGDGCSATCDTESDTDGDGAVDVADNCPNVANADQADADSDGIGDACDVGGTGGALGDDDGDGVSNNVDNCPNVANADQEDTDTDGIGDACDCNGGDCTGGGGCSLIR
ncbi:MAG TPA: thrombospondin type 3 repeat-containing protein [bacterium]|nr:thrombospondin type 3 repeat-containing protein [bacterium]